MRRTALKALVTMSLTALSVAVAACATAPAVDDGSLSGLSQDQKPTSPDPDQTTSAKLPPPSDPTAAANNASTDAGSTTAHDSGSTTTTDAGTAPPPVDSGTTPPPSTGGGDCDPNNPMYYIEFVEAANPTPCPCSSSQCCYLGTVCLDP